MSNLFFFLVRPGAPNAVVVVVAVLFALILMLPMQGESNSLFPEYLKPNVNVKLFAAYVLGKYSIFLDMKTFSTF